MDSTVPADLLKLKTRLEAWRATRRYTRQPIPDEFRQAAAEMAGRYSPSLVRSALKLDPWRLKKPSTKKPSRAHHERQTAFFSLQPEAAMLLPEPSAPKYLTGCRLQIERPDGSRLTLILPTIDLASAKQRVQEMINLRACDLQLTHPYQLRLLGKGRKERFFPLWSQTAQVLREFCEERGLDHARPEVATLAQKRLYPHSIHHSTAVALLKSGVDLSTISQWLGHSCPSTTNRYATIDLEMKRQAIDKVKPIPGSGKASWRKDQTILEWLENL